MAYEHREGSGTLFKNHRRDKDTQPNARGEALIGGVVYEISAWTKQTKTGEPWQSLSFKPKQMSETDRRKERKPPTSKEEIPF
ncbi:MAG: hypothetical protein FJX76_01545 [Armatimonadetes bacterium]|nr:hypothetical protein [Armatimonadota bacterium]MBM3738926.1 hypothetical protein [Acidobacteriota bacterium]